MNKKDKKKEGEKIILKIARRLDKETLESLSEKIKKVFGGEEIKVEIDESIIGGFWAKSKNYLIDCTVKGALNKIKNKVYGNL